METGMNAEQAAAMSDADWARYQFRELLSALTGSEPTAEELNNLATAWPIVTHLLSSAPLIHVDEFLRGLSDDLFGRLYALACDLCEWSTSDLDSWPQEFYCLTAFACAQ
jgi:hypothetical protein